jgi:hypothetical protein
MAHRAFANESILHRPVRASMERVSRHAQHCPDWEQLSVFSVLQITKSHTVEQHVRWIEHSAPPPPALLIASAHYSRYLSVLHGPYSTDPCLSALEDENHRGTTRPAWATGRTLRHTNSHHRFGLPEGFMGLTEDPKVFTSMMGRETHRRVHEA